jgi:hypothetical protein
MMARVYSNLRSDSVAARFFSCLVLKLALDLFLLSHPGLDILRVHLASAHLPLHELVECAIGIVGQLFVSAFLSDLALSIDADDTVGTFDGRKTMRNANRRIVVQEKLAQSLIYKGLGLCVESACCLIEDENVGLLDQCSCNGNALLLSTRKLSATSTDMCLKTIRL